MIYLHVGFPKTATTTIQTFLSSNRPFLASRNLVYPDLSVDESDLLGVGARGHNTLAVELRRGEPGEHWRRLRALMANEPDRNYVVSGESLAGCEPKTLKAAIGGGDAVIISYVRPWAQLIQSQYSHLTKIGVSVANFDDFFDQRLERSNFDLPLYYRRWCNTFGVSNVRVRSLDGGALKHGDVRRDILDALDVDASGELGPDVKLTTSTNEALGWKSVEILRKLNTELRRRYLAGKDADAFRLEKRARQQRLESPLLDFAADLAKVANQFGDDAGFSDRGRYLTLRQQRRSSRLFDRHMRELAEMGLPVAASEAAAGEFSNRPFLPTYDAVPKDDVRAFLARLRELEEPANLAGIGWRELIDRLSGDAA